MNAAAYEIQGSIPILEYEGKRSPLYRDMALAWIVLAEYWAMRRGYDELAELARNAENSIFTAIAQENERSSEI